jgi:hypothetical protein
MGARCSTQVHIMSNFPLVFQIEKEKVMSSYVFLLLNMEEGFMKLKFHIPLKTKQSGLLNVLVVIALYFWGTWYFGLSYFLEHEGL